MRPSLAAGWVLMLLPSLALAQPAGSIIESVGTATVYGAPNRADFWLHYEVRGENLLDATRKSREFEARLNSAIAEREIAGVEVEVSPVNLPDAGDTVASLSARLRFGLSIFSAEEGDAEFAALCDAVAELAQALGCRIEGPVFTLSEPSVLVRQAAARATADAYAAAEAIAAEMNATIAAVETVSVSEIRWNSDPERRVALPNLREAACTVLLRVVYTLSTS